MNVSVEGLLFIFKIMSLSAIVGWAFTAGVWGFCKMIGWAPVNITANTTVYERD